VTTKILVIDDAPEIHTLIKIGLAREPVEVHSAFDGPSGLAATHALRPDLILLDVEMPGANGFAVCVALKACEATREIPVIFLTVSATTDEKVRGLNLGATDYVTKPFSSTELCARVRAALRTMRLVELLSKKAMIDSLTGLWNRSYLDSQLSVQLAAARQVGQPLSCVMADIDQLQAINETYGHGFGDDVFRAIAALITQLCRVEDVPCRWGGDEFAILLPNTKLQDAANLAERIRLGVEGISLCCCDTPVKVTCSLGVAELRGPFTLSVIERADESLHRAKHAGRNRIEVYQEPQLSMA
jgi:two-component system cell cycle response regulator